MTVPIILTNDLETASDHDERGHSVSLRRILQDLKLLNAPCTFFTTLDALIRYKNDLIEYTFENIEIGCHGINHESSENYKFLDYNTIDSNLKTFDDYAVNHLGVKPVCFRGPFFSTSAVTQRALYANGYLADFSVCSQRLDFFISKGGNLKWVLAPRSVYRPCVSNPYKKGSGDILVVPMSCALIPFNSGSLYLFGLEFMKRFFRFLLREASRKPKPVVYQFHSYEFSELSGRTANTSSVHKLYMSNREKRYNTNLQLIRYMLSFKNKATPVKASGIAGLY